MINVTQYHRIRWLLEREGLSQRQIAEQLGLSRNTVAKYVAAGDLPTALTRKKVYGNHKPSAEVQRVLPLIEQWLLEDQGVWKKQRHTAARIHQRLVKEYGFVGSASNVRRVVAQYKQTIKEVFIPLEFQLGHQFQVDWGQADVIVQGKLRRIHLFCVELSASRKKFVCAYEHERQEAFLDGFVRALRSFGGVPSEGLLDNLTSAVAKMLRGRERLEQETFLSLQAHYLFKAEYCNPRSGNEKGIIETLVGIVRRRALVPLPEVQSMEELDALLLAWCESSALEDIVPHSHETVAAVWEREKETLHPLPLSPFEACRLRMATVSKTATVTFETNAYSVPSQYIGQRVFLKVFVEEVRVVVKDEVIATHKRCYEREQMRLVLDHYLDVLVRKPRAIRDARAMYAADIPEIVRQFQREMRTHHGAQGDRSFIHFLLLHREVGMETITTVLTKAQAAQMWTFEGLHELLLRQTGQTTTVQPMDAEKVPTELQEYRVHKTDVNQYNALSARGEK